MINRIRFLILWIFGGVFVVFAFLSGEFVEPQTLHSKMPKPQTLHSKMPKPQTLHCQTECKQEQLKVALRPPLPQRCNEFKYWRVIASIRLRV